MGYVCRPDWLDLQSLTFPPPKPPRPIGPRSATTLLPQTSSKGHSSLPSPPRPVVQRNFQQHDLHSHHDDRLDEETEIVARAGPVEDFENGGCEHD